MDREVRSAAPLPVADAAVDLLYVLLAESLSVRGEEWTKRGLSGDRLGSAEIRLKIRPAVHRLLRSAGDSARRRNATEIFAVDVAAALAEHWCKVWPFCLRVGYRARAGMTDRGLTALAAALDFSKQQTAFVGKSASVSPASPRTTSEAEATFGVPGAV